MPVKANMPARRSRADLVDVLRRADSICRISAVAPMPVDDVNFTAYTTSK
jgi:hypothetical protein